MTSAQVSAPAASPSFSPSLVEGARAAIDRFARERGVRVVHAVFTGPRAWGLPFEDKTGAEHLVIAGLFTHPVPAYLGLAEPADILRAPGEGEGEREEAKPPLLFWDARKALRLVPRSNATVWEWISARDPLVDGGAPIAALRDLAGAHYSRSTLLGHYLGLAKVAMNAYFQDTPREAARIKYMHTARALMAVDWILTKDAPPPSDWASLRAGTDLPEGAAGPLDALALAPLEERRHPVVDAWIDTVFQAARDKGEALKDSHPPTDLVDPIFRDLLGPVATKN